MHKPAYYIHPHTRPLTHTHTHTNISGTENSCVCVCVCVCGCWGILSLCFDTASSVMQLALHHKRPVCCRDLAHHIPCASAMHLTPVAFRHLGLSGTQRSKHEYSEWSGLLTELRLLLTKTPDSWASSFAVPVASAIAIAVCSSAVSTKHLYQCVSSEGSISLQVMDS